MIKVSIVIPTVKTEKEIKGIMGKKINQANIIGDNYVFRSTI